MAVYNEKPGDEFDFTDFEKVQNPNEIKDNFGSTKNCK